MEVISALELAIGSVATAVACVLCGKINPLISVCCDHFIEFNSVGFLCIIAVGFLQGSEYASGQDIARKDLGSARIARKRDDVFLPREFADLGGDDQVLRALRELVRGGRLIRLGYGVYGRAQRSKLTGQPVLAARGGFVGASRAALSKLGVPWEPSELERSYYEGRSTQIPVDAVIRVKGRFSRRLGYRGNMLVVR